MKTPFPVTYRELWLPQHIRSTHLPPSAPGGHALTLTGASKQTTADGVHFTGAATSNIVVTAAAGQNAKAAIHITRRFKLDQTFAAGSTSQYLFNKAVDADNYMRIRLSGADGKLYWEGKAGAAIFSLVSTTVSWAAGTWYIITVSSTDGPVQRLLVNGAVEDSDTAGAVATPNGGDIVLGSSSDGGTDGFKGTESWVVIGVGTTAATALTTAEETDLSKGAPPATAKVQYMFLMDEGLGTTATDRGSAGGNGTLDSACTWQFGQVKAPTISLDGINDTGLSSSGVLIKEPLTVVWAGKWKSTYSNLAGVHILLQLTIDGNNDILLYYRPVNNVFRWNVNGGGVITMVDYVLTPTIDSYGIWLAIVSSTGTSSLFYNGSLVGSSAGGGALSGAAGRVRLGAEAGPSNYDGSLPLFVALLEGALTAAQAKTYSRYLRDKYNLPGTFA